MTSRHAAVTSEGFTHASRVMPVVRWRLAASGTVTRAVVPLNASPLPYLPAVVQVAFWIVPTFPRPDASLTEEPLPSSNAYAATSSAAVDCVVALATFEYGPRFPAASVA